MLSRLTPFVGLSLFFISCGKQDDEPDSRAKAEHAVPPVTKLQRPPTATGKTPSRKEFRVQLESALAQATPEQQNQVLSDTAWACGEQKRS